MDFIMLNIPMTDIPVRYTASGLQIFDRLRAKYVALTPEEWVRQQFVEWIIWERQFPASLMANEKSLRVNGRLRRCDTIVYDQSLLPLAVVEYKAPSVAINQKVFDQIARYNLTLGAGYLIVTNGMQLYACRYKDGSYSYLADIPLFSDL